MRPIIAASDAGIEKGEAVSDMGAKDLEAGTGAGTGAGVDTARRGRMRRTDKAMTPEEIDALLSRVFCGRTATVGADGYPYLVPNLFVWRAGEVYLHTALSEGHFIANVRLSDRICFEADEPGEIFPYGHVECDTSVSYRSVIVFGRIRIVEEEAEKTAFYQAFLQKYAPEESWGREKGSFPRMRSTIVYAITPDAVTGKEGRLPPLADRWPNSNRLSGSPGWKSATSPPAGD
jgi:nitroimidazol reductase NimA-like FMN-containing flavoprotein (pyridoxamine 5'-phosphate oxidase superfamily)